MELIKYEANWFLSDAGCNAFASLTTLDERSVFLYSYLKQIAPTDFEENQLLFRVAFFFADAIMGSTLPYSAYPALLDPKKNPFVEYLTKATVCPGIQGLYCIFLAILHGTADCKKKDEWIYADRIPEAYSRDFCGSETALADPAAFEIDESLQLVQLKLIWLLGSEEARG